MNECRNGLYTAAVLYAAIVTVVVAIANASGPYDPDTPTKLDPALFLLWTLLYLPTLVLPGVGGWRLRDLGWGLGAIGLVFCVLIVGLCGGVARINATLDWRDAAVEAFARTGEEVFVRGFIFRLIERAFRGRRYGMAWAVVGSALLFTGMHTTAFSAAVQIGRDATPAAYVVIERLGDIFLLALGLGLLRAATGSIIPGAFVHAIANGGAITAPFVGLIAIAIGYWGHRRGEHLFEGIAKAMSRPSSA